ncbi:helix-turn-helix transcriptional regulator [Acidobacteriota bacterium]
MKYLTRKEEILLLAALRLEENASLVKIMDYLNNNTEREWTAGNLYVALQKLRNMGYLSSFEGNPTARRGGRAAKYYRLTHSGLMALSKVKILHESLWKGMTVN